MAHFAVRPSSNACSLPNVYVNIQVYWTVESRGAPKAKLRTGEFKLD